MANHGPEDAKHGICAPEPPRDGTYDDSPNTKETPPAIGVSPEDAHRAIED